MRYRHVKRNMLLQFSENIFTVNVLPKYPGWKRMESDILDNWENVSGIVNPYKILRIGLRYINRIDRIIADEKAAKWLKPNEYIPNAALSSLPGFISRTEVRPASDSRTVVTLGEIHADINGNRSSFILDIDCSVEKDMETSRESLKHEMLNLPDREWEIFSSTITPEMHTFLSGGTDE